MALKLADPYNPLALSPEQQAIAQALYNHARSYTYDDELNFHFGNNPNDPDGACERFTLSAAGALVATANFDCGDENTNYKPRMFPVANFFSIYAPPVQPTLSFDQFDPSLFCNTPADGTNCFFFNPGRRSVYGQMAQTWTQSPPTFTNNGLGDYTVSFRTYSGNYLSARYGGGYDVDAESTAIGPWEQFSLLDRTSGSTQLNDGDQVTLQAMGMVPNRAEGDLLTATNGGGAGSVMNANQLYPHENETFTIHKLNGTGAINNGDPVALTSTNGDYVSAAGGGGGSVTVDRTAAQAWETFTITINHN